MITMYRKHKRYRLSIGKPLIVKEGTFDVSDTRSNGDSWIDYNKCYHNTKNNAFLLESDNEGECFSISFDCSRQSGTNSECSIDIFNLDDELTEYIISNADKDLVVKLEAGYDEELSKVIEGTVSCAYDSWSKQDRVMSMIVEDAAVNIRSAYTVRQYAANTPYEKIVDDLISDLKLKRGKVTKLDKYPVTKVPVSYSGNTNEIIHMLAKKYKNVFTINDSLAFLTPIDRRVNSLAVFLSASTGLIGDASKKRNRKKVKSNAKDDILTFKCQLDSTIYPDLSVYVQDNTIDSAVKVEKVRLRGAYPEGVWECVIDGLLVGDQIVDN